MTLRTLSLMDSLIGQIDKAINVLAAPAQSVRAFPAAPGGHLELTEVESRTSARLMRVNHAGEVAAQALYQGQALTARDVKTVESLRQAAAEEVDHLAWCEGRLQELNGRTSLLNPLWYAGSFAIGAVAGAFGDRVSLGFIAETEKQVETHLRGHLDRLPAADSRSRAVVEQMTHDEAGHGAMAAALGADELPLPLRFAMQLASRVMIVSAYWL